MHFLARASNGSLRTGGAWICQGILKIPASLRSIQGIRKSLKVWNIQYTFLDSHSFCKVQLLFTLLAPFLLRNKVTSGQSVKRDYISLWTMMNSSLVLEPFFALPLPLWGEGVALQMSKLWWNHKIQRNWTGKRTWLIRRWCNLWEEMELLWALLSVSAVHTVLVQFSLLPIEYATTKASQSHWNEVTISVIATGK